MNKVLTNGQTVRNQKKLASLGNMGRFHSPNLRCDLPDGEINPSDNLKEPLRQKFELTRHGSQRECSYVSKKSSNQVLSARRSEIATIVAPRRFITLQDKLDEFSSKGMDSSPLSLNLYNKATAEPTSATASTLNFSPNTSRLKKQTLNHLTKALQVKALYMKAEEPKHIIVPQVAPKASVIDVKTRATAALSSALSSKVANLLQLKQNTKSVIANTEAPNQLVASNMFSRKHTSIEVTEPQLLKPNNIDRTRMKDDLQTLELDIDRMIQHHDEIRPKEASIVGKSRPSKLLLQSLISKPPRASYKHETNSSRNRFESPGDIAISEGKLSSRLQEDTAAEYITLEKGLKVMSKRVVPKSPKSSLFTPRSGMKSLTNQTPSNMVSKTSLHSSKEKQSRACLAEVFKRRAAELIDENDSTSKYISNPTSTSPPLVPRLAIGPLMTATAADSTIILALEDSFFGNEEAVTSRKSILEVLSHM